MCQPYISLNLKQYIKTHGSESQGQESTKLAHENKSITTTASLLHERMFS